MSASDHQYALNWSNYTSHLKKAFDTLLTGNEFVDVTLSCEGKKISAHKMLLSACSPYFHDLFRDNPCQHPIVILKGVKFQNLVDLLTFMYSGEVNVPTENLNSFLKTAELLHISGLKGERNLTIDTENEHQEPNDTMELSQHTRSLLRKHTEAAQEIIEASADRQNDNANASEENINKKQKIEMDFGLITEIKQEQVDVLNIEHEEFTSDDPLSIDNMDMLQPSIKSEMSDSGSELDCTSPKKEAEAKTENLLPPKSKDRYEKAYKLYKDWCTRKALSNIGSESVVLAYFSELAEKRKSSTLWSNYSMLRTTLNIRIKVDIAKFAKLRAYLKRQNIGYKAKKSNVFTMQDIDKFLKNGPLEFLPQKVALIIGVSGACRGEELLKLKTGDIDVFEKKITVSISDSRAYGSRAFVITDSEWVKIVKQYIDLRKNVENDRFFLQLKFGKVTKQPFGHNSIAQFPKKIATYLKLKDVAAYTGHCFRRTATTLLASSGGGVMQPKRFNTFASTSTQE